MLKIIGFMLFSLGLCVAGIVATPEIREMLNISYKVLLFAGLLAGIIISARREIKGGN